MWIPLILLWKQTEENVPQYEGIISEYYERLRTKYLQESPEMQTQVDGQKMVQSILPKRADLDKILKIIQRKLKRHTFNKHHKRNPSSSL